MQFPTGPTARRRRPCSRGSSQTGLQVLMPSAHHSPMEAKRWPGSCRPIVMAALAARPTRAKIKNTKQFLSLDFRRAGAKRPLVAAAYFKELLRQISCNLTSEDPDPCLRSLFSTAARYDDISADAKTQRRFGMLEISNSSSDHASLSKV